MPPYQSGNQVRSAEWLRDIAREADVGGLDGTHLARVVRVKNRRSVIEALSAKSASAQAAVRSFSGALHAASPMR